MAKVTALKKADADAKGAVNESKSCRLPNVEIPGLIMAAVQKYIKEKGYSMTQFWKEAASHYLQAEEIPPAREKLDRLLEQIAQAEDRLRELEEKEQVLLERELRIEEVERSQSAQYEERLDEFVKMTKELEQEYQARLAEVNDIVMKNEEDHKAKIGKIEEEVRERSDEYRRHLELEFSEKEKELLKREAGIEVREEIAAEKEKFWSTMYDAVVKLTRVCGTLK